MSMRSARSPRRRLKRADDDGFARAGFAGNHVEARPQGEGQISNKGQILDAQNAEHAAGI